MVHDLLHKFRSYRSEYRPQVVSVFFRLSFCTPMLRNILPASCILLAHFQGHGCTQFLVLWYYTRLTSFYLRAFFAPCVKSSKYFIVIVSAGGMKKSPTRRWEIRQSFVCLPCCCQILMASGLDLTFSLISF